ncbi:hypothetical protein RQP46_006325 [Phenoliferia psychrophenolica]
MAATNASSGLLLAFPNEVLDDILGQLLTSVPPDQKPANPRKSPQLEALEAVSLVSKKWRAVALRRLVAKLVVRTGKRARAIVQSLTAGDLGGLVKEITIEGSVSRFAGVPTAAALAKNDSVTPEDVVALLHLTRRLDILRLHYVDFVRFRQRDVATLSTLPFLTTVETLSITSAECDINLELVATLVPLFLALRTIILSLPTSPKIPRFKSPPASHPFLETLEVALVHKNSSMTTVLSLISIPRPGQIKSLKFKSHGQPPDLDRLLKQVGPGLETLEWESFEGLTVALSHCPRLISLRIHYLWSVYHFQVLKNFPASIATLRLYHGYRDLLEAIKVVPKPAGLVRLEFMESYRHEIQSHIPMLEAYGLEVVFGDWSW